MTRMRMLVVVTLGVLALGGTGQALAATAGPYPPPSQGSGTVSPSRIKAGECAVFSGNGFAPVTPVTVTDNGDPRGTTTSHADGTFSMQVCYSSGAKPGRHELVGTGAGAGGGTLSVSATLIVQGVRQTATIGNSEGAVSAQGTGSGKGVGTGTGEAGGTLLPFTGAPQLLVLGVAGLVAVFLASLILLLVPRHRRARRPREAALSA